LSINYKKEYSNINNKPYKLESAKKERELHRSIKLNKKRELKVGKIKEGRRPFWWSRVEYHHLNL